ncbi:hypothetical protein SAY86_022146 [Trapa natans]|uniref:Uncharacterized protein n=1 Tax=Trapa natans TaxID=22666 RepID=A0AAN7MAX6_TRANT|nr:hypothetical protein SAY86_022146 [Trapa natans]
MILFTPNSDPNSPNNAFLGSCNFKFLQCVAYLNLPIYPIRLNLPRSLLLRVGPFISSLRLSLASCSILRRTHEPLRLESSLVKQSFFMVVEARQSFSTFHGGGSETIIFHGGGTKKKTPRYPKLDAGGARINGHGEHLH